MERKYAGVFFGVVEELLENGGVVEKLKSGSRSEGRRIAGRLFELVISAELTLSEYLVHGLAAGTAEELPIVFDG